MDSEFSEFVDEPIREIGRGHENGLSNPFRALGNKARIPVLLCGTVGFPDLDASEKEPVEGGPRPYVPLFDVIMDQADLAQTESIQKHFPFFHGRAHCGEDLRIHPRGLRKYSTNQPWSR
ncbi:MAG: hypothetical protein E6K16_05085 [Methanobacteriota archaeon]|nr:MAG: hypothetical protein E6K16_05085 [Euryarchaeota archaeon]